MPGRAAAVSWYARAPDASTYGNVFTESPPQNIVHDVEYCWIGSQTTFEVWVDGTRKL